MKWRNQFLALFCLVLFFAFGVFYFRTWVVQKPFGIILFVGEGLDPARLTAARIYAGGADVPLTIDLLPYTALLKNYSKDFATPDQAAAASALATGTKVKNGVLSLDAEGKGLTNLIELARESGRMTGLITNALVTDPSAAAFYAHTSEKDNRTQLARTLVENAEIDIVMGGGAADFLPMEKEGRRTDDRDLLLEARNGGYEFVHSLEELDGVPRWRRAKLVGLFSPAEMALSADEAGRGEQPTLSDMVRRGIELLQYNSGGYLLVVDAGLMGMAARARNGQATLAETVALDQAISVAQRYAGTKSTIIVCGDVGVGGLSFNGFSPLGEGGAEVFEAKPGARQWLSWVPNEIPNEVLDPSGAALPDQTEKPTVNTGGDVIAFGSGLGADALQGTLDNTAVFEILRDNL